MSPTRTCWLLIILFPSVNLQEFRQSEYLLVADQEVKRLFQIDLNLPQVLGSISLNAPSPAVAIDPTSTVVYWSDTSQKKVKSSYLNGEYIKDVFSTGDRSFAERLAVDASTGNIFYSSNVFEGCMQCNYIAVASPDGKYQRKLVTELNNPRAIELHSSKGIMFWSDYGNDPHIGRANMDGSDRKTIISTDIKMPNGIAIDFEEDVLYWTDGSRNVIERCSFNGTNRQVILEDPDALLMGLAIYKGTLYYTSWNKRGVTKAFKRDNGNYSTFYVGSGEYVKLSDLIKVRPNGQQTATPELTMNGADKNRLIKIIVPVVGGVVVIAIVVTVVVLIRKRKARRPPN